MGSNIVHDVANRLHVVLVDLLPEGHNLAIGSLGVKENTALEGNQLVDNVALEAFLENLKTGRRDTGVVAHVTQGRGVTTKTVGSTWMG